MKFIVLSIVLGISSLALAENLQFKNVPTITAFSKLVVGTDDNAKTLARANCEEQLALAINKIKNLKFTIIGQTNCKIQAATSEGPNSFQDDSVVALADVYFVTR